jgi:nucleotide-binding universal stress UspA family protein
VLPTSGPCALVGTLFATHAESVNEELVSRRIVVGVDGSTASERAVRWAATEAERRGAALDVVHAWMTPYPPNPFEHFADPAPFEAQGAEILDRATKSLVVSSPLNIQPRPVLVREYPSKALVHSAEGAELLVVGSRGRGGFSGLLLGSVSQSCAHHAPCPVAVIPHGWSAREHGRVVVGVDGSPPSYGALRWAVDEAVLRNARLDVVNAYNYLEVLMPMLISPGIDCEVLEKASTSLLEQMLGSVIPLLGPRPPAVELIAVHTGAARALLETAVGADLLIVGSRGRDGVRGLLLGSVSQQCVHHAPCPVIVVRERDGEQQGEGGEK